MTTQPAAPAPYRPLMKGMGEAVARRTILRDLNTTFPETWGDVATRVAHGNTRLHETGARDFAALREHIAQGRVLMSGRHLQHGDSTQPGRNQEVFTNCSTAATTHLLFTLLLNGSGVGRAYDDALMIVDWAKYMPNVVVVLSKDHPDFKEGVHMAAENLYPDVGRNVQQVWLGGEWQDVDIYHRIDDSREGWGKGIELLETLTFARTHADQLVVLDFSAVRGEGSPIRGMQNRPASGPVPLMDAITRIVQTIRGSGMAPWKATMTIDHLLAEVVVVGGARRAARMSTKFWRDLGICDFISIKAEAGLWSSNNSIGVDKDFWRGVTKRHGWARIVYDAAIKASYLDGTGEPGFINLDKLHANSEGMADMLDGNFIGSDKYQPGDDAKTLYAALVQALGRMKYHYIVNPCAEIALHVLGGFCVIADTVPAFCKTVQEWEDACIQAGRALIRTNLMNSIYGKEVRRTNRIGIGFTGFHEFAWTHFGATWYDMLDDKQGPGQKLWAAVRRVRRAVEKAMEAYAAELGVNVPHTMFTVKPAGTTSKLFGLTEGAHLPSMVAFLRNVQFRTTDPLVEQYRAKGYPMFESKTYAGTTVVGFPTVPYIAKIMPENLIVTAAQATPEDQYRYLQLIEKHWLGKKYPNQVSYTLKMDVTKVSHQDYYDTVAKFQQTVACCSVMPFDPRGLSAYEYLPETPMDLATMIDLLAGINDDGLKEDIDMDSLQCASGACPI